MGSVEVVKIVWLDGLERVVWLCFKCSQDKFLK